MTKRIDLVKDVKQIGKDIVVLSNDTCTVIKDNSKNFWRMSKDFCKYVKNYKSVYYSWWTNGIGGSGAQLLKMDSNGKLRPYKFFYECFKSMYSTKKLFYYGKSGIKDSKKVSQKKFKKLNVKYLGKKLGKVKTYEFNANTKTNRNKYLKQEQI